MDHQHSYTHISILMTASIFGCLQSVEKLISLGANLYLKSCNDLTALEWSKRFTKNEITELFEALQ